MTRANSTNWHRLIRRLHGDVGFVCIGLVVVFSLSGLALNHSRDWDPNYKVALHEFKLDDIDEQSDATEMVKSFQQKSGLSVRIKARIWESPHQLKIFTEEQGTISINRQQGMARQEKLQARPLLKQFNQLHLNEAGGLWVWIADIFALFLLFLAFSGLWMSKGKYKYWLTASGITLPAIAWLLWL
ncbi:hypothetical protein GCM10009092_20950 [Bowmanella denitrificans]|uniref:Peptidase n=1 Tax=Bowmanella denitrificans TaxID=366582 RepID=A0ABN0X6S4_9ALTE